MKLCLILNIAPHYRKGIFELLDKEFDCHFICGNQYGNIKPLDFSVLKGSFQQEKRISLLGGLTWQSGTVSALFKKHDAYIITGDYRDLSAWAMLVLSKLLGKKVYLWTHGWYGRESRMKRFIKKTFSFFAAGEFVYGDHAKQVMLKNGYKPNKVYVVHNSLDYSVQLQERNNLSASSIYTNRFGNTNKTLLFIGRLTKIKQLDLLIDAIAVLKKKGENYNLIFVGDGETRKDLEIQAASLGLYCVWFVGAVYDEHEKAQLIYNADLCVSPGNVGLTALDSMMFGTPVATHNDFKNQMPEFEVVKQGKTGFFFERNVKSIADGISSWFASQESRSLLRENCFNEIDKNWTPQYQLSVFKQVLTLYE